MSAFAQLVPLDRGQYSRRSPIRWSERQAELVQRLLEQHKRRPTLVDMLRRLPTWADDGGRSAVPC